MNLTFIIIIGMIILSCDGTDHIPLRHFIGHETELQKPCLNTEAAIRYLCCSRTSPRNSYSHFWRIRKPRKQQ